MNKKLFQAVKKSFSFMYKHFPIMGGYSAKDAADLMDDPDNYNYKGNSWFKKQEDKLLKK